MHCWQHVLAAKTAPAAAPARAHSSSTSKGLTPLKALVKPSTRRPARGTVATLPLPVPLPILLRAPVLLLSPAPLLLPPAPLECASVLKELAPDPLAAPEPLGAAEPLAGDNVISAALATTLRHSARSAQVLGAMPLVTGGSWYCRPVCSSRRLLFALPICAGGHQVARVRGIHVMRWVQLPHQQHEYQVQLVTTDGGRPASAGL